MQLVLVVFFLLSTSANTPLALIVVTATCAGCVFPQSTSALLMCILQLALCGGGGGACCGCIYVVVVVYMWW